MVIHHTGLELIPHHISSVVEDLPACDIKPCRGASSWENLQCLATSQSAAMPSYSSRTKALSCQKAPIWRERKRLHCSPSLHLSSTTPSSCCAGFGSEKGIFILVFSAGGQSSLGCGIRGDVAMFPLLRFSTLPSSPSGIASSAFHLPWETAASCTVEPAQSCVQRSVPARHPTHDA